MFFIPANLFKLKSDYFAIAEWTTDHSDKRAGIRVESDSKPDFVIRISQKMMFLQSNVTGELILSIIKMFEIMSLNRLNPIKQKITKFIPRN